MGRDIVLKRAKPVELHQLRLLATGLAATASDRELERLASKGWLEASQGHYLITLARRILLEKPPFNLD